MRRRTFLGLGALSVVGIGAASGCSSTVPSTDPPRSTAPSAPAALSTDPVRARQEQELARFVLDHPTWYLGYRADGDDWRARVMRQPWAYLT